MKVPAGRSDSSLQALCYTQEFWFDQAEYCAMVAQWLHCRQGRSDDYTWGSSSSYITLICHRSIFFADSEVNVWVYLVGAVKDFKNPPIVCCEASLIKMQISDNILFAFSIIKASCLSWSITCTFALHGDSICVVSLRPLPCCTRLRVSPPSVRGSFRDT